MLEASFDGQEEGIPYVVFDGEKRFLSNQPCPEHRFGIPSWGMAAMPVISRSEWRPVSMRHLPIHILNQGQRKSCTANASAQGIMRNRALQGLTLQILSAAYIYSYINGGRDAGSSISAALKVLMRFGTCLASQVPEDMIYRKQIENQVPDADKTAQRFRVSAGYHLDSIDAIFSAIQLNFIVVHGVCAGRGFGNINANGTCPVIKGPANHAICADGMYKDGSTWCLDDINSWGERFAHQGRFGTREESLHISGQDSYAIQVVASDPEESEPIPNVA